MRDAEVIAVGSELLTPFRSDTNSLYLTARLNELGIDVRGKSVARDETAALAALVREASARSGLVILTGGLGPTDDDVTRDAVAAALGRALHEDAEVLARLEQRFASRQMQMSPLNRRQAQVIDGAEVLPNPHGTAPGLWLATAEGLVVLLPGPPRELQPMFETHVAPRLAAMAGGRRVIRRVIKITGKTESAVDEMAQPIYRPWLSAAVPIETSILATPGQIELHLSARDADPVRSDEALEAGVQALAAALGTCVFSVDGRPLEQVVADGLVARRWRLAVAESCTGGLVLGRLTEVAGASGWLTGGIVAYDNAVKTEALGVDPALMAAHGAVSEAVAEAMAAGVARRQHADVAVAITGIAGPTGGSVEKPVGTVVFAVVTPGQHAVRTMRLPGDRRTVRQHAVAAALDMIRRAILPLDR